MQAQSSISWQSVESHSPRLAQCVRTHCHNSSVVCAACPISFQQPSEEPLRERVLLWQVGCSQRGSAWTCVGLHHFSLLLKWVYVVLQQRLSNPDGDMKVLHCAVKRFPDSTCCFPCTVHLCSCACTVRASSQSPLWLDCSSPCVLSL